MRLPRVQGILRRRLLVNFRVEPAVVQRHLPEGLRPRLHAGHAIAGVCLIRLEQLRPPGVPSFLGISSENAAHRVAVAWRDASGALREGVFIHRRDTDSLLGRLAGGRVFPGEHFPARFTVADSDGRIELSMQSLDGAVRVHVAGRDADRLPPTSCFGTLAQASAFFEAGTLGYSATSDAGRLDGLILRTHEWRARAFEVAAVDSSYFSNPDLFPEGSVAFDHALVMRDLAHEWLRAEDLALAPGADPGAEAIPVPVMPPAVGVRASQQA